MIRLLLDSTAEGIYGLDPQGICTFCNAACVRILGYDNADQIIGRNMHDFIHPSHADGTAIPAKECKLLKDMDRQFHCDSDVFWRANGSSFPVEYWSYPIRQDDQNLGQVVSFVDITERKKAQEQQLLAQFSIEHTSDAVFWVDAQGQFKFVNAAACQQLGYSRDELLNMSVADIDPDWPAEKWPEHFDQLRQHKQIMIETCHRTSNGDILHVEVSANYFKQQDMEFNFAFVRNVTKRKQAEEALSESEIKYRTLFESMIEEVHFWELVRDKQGNIKTWRLVDANPASLKSWKKTREQTVGKTADEIWPNSNVIELFMPIVKKIVEERIPYRWESYFEKTDQTLAMTSVAFGEYFFSTGRDITEQKQAEEAIRKNEGMLRDIVESTYSGFWDWNLANNTEYLSPSFKKMFGYEDHELESSPEAWQKIIFPEDLPGVFEMFDKHVKSHGREPYYGEVRYRHRDGSTVWVICAGRVIEWAEDGTPIRMAGCHFDITARKAAEEETKRFKTIADSAVYGKAIADLEGNLVYVNNYLAELHGYAPEELHGKHLSIFHTTTQLVHVDNTINLSRQNGYFPPCEVWHTHRNGTEFPMLMSGVLLKDDHGNPQYLAASAVDITKRKQAQLALEQKNAELEQFVYSVSHDLKSPLVTVKTFAGMLRQDLQNADQQQIIEDLNYIDKGADKMQQLLDALLKYSRIGRIDTPAQTLSADQSVQNCLTTLAGILPQHQIQVSTGDFHHQLHGDPMHFGQIWQNLIENAVKYRGDQAQPHIEIGATQEGHEVVFYVRDNGMGIAQEHWDRIFNLFSQLNAGSDGSGLGLALVKKIVSIYHGRIWVESEGAGRGSCFYFTLPSAVNSQLLVDAEDQSKMST